MGDTHGTLSKLKQISKTFLWKSEMFGGVERVVIATFFNKNKFSFLKTVRWKVEGRKSRWEEALSKISNILSSSSLRDGGGKQKEGGGVNKTYLKFN